MEHKLKFDSISRGQWQRRIARAFAIGCLLGMLWIWISQALVPRSPITTGLRQQWKGIPGKSLWI